MVQVRPADDGLVLQQLLYADEVRSLKDLDIEPVAVSAAELKLALQLVEQIAADSYEPSQYEDQEKKRILAAIDAKIAGKQIVATSHAEDDAGGGQVIDLMAALQASLGKTRAAKPAPAKARREEPAPVAPLVATAERKPVRRAAKAAEPAAPVRARARK